VRGRLWFDKPRAAPTRPSDRLIGRPRSPDASDPKLIVGAYGGDTDWFERVVLWLVLPALVALVVVAVSEQAGVTRLTPEWWWRSPRDWLACERMANWRLDELPARCAGYYGVGRLPR